MPEIEIAVVGWSLIGILFVIAILVTRWSIRVHKRIFNNEVQKAVQEELRKDRAAEERTQNPHPGSQEHYEKWKAERQNKEP